MDNIGKDLVDINEKQQEFGTEFYLKQFEAQNNALTIQNKLIQQAMKHFEAKFGAIEARNEAIERRLDLVETKANRTTDHDGYVVQKGLGHKFRIAIGSVYVGRLLVKSGLARKFYDDNGCSNTVPKQRTLDAGIAKPYITDTGYQHYSWACERTIQHIESYITELGLWDEFITINSAKKMQDFINRIPAKTTRPHQ